MSSPTFYQQCKYDGTRADAFSQSKWKETRNEHAISLVVTSLVRPKLATQLEPVWAIIARPDRSTDTRT